MHSPEHEERCLLYEAGELGAAQAAAFERVLAGCEDCRAFMAGIKESHRLCGAARLSPSLELDERVLARLAPSERDTRAGLPAGRPWRAMGMSLAFAGAAALVLMSRWDFVPGEELEWTGSIETRIAAAQDEMEAVSESVAPGYDADIEGDIETLERSADELEDLWRERG
ncbi:MAG: hypothetical protein HY927_03610 [Elusimicrobia bacterium]|nr:hypothetical protein [Elusimicrobiota bacterium]